MSFEKVWQIPHSLHEIVEQKDNQMDRSLFWPHWFFVTFGDNLSRFREKYLLF